MNQHLKVHNSYLSGLCKCEKHHGCLIRSLHSDASHVLSAIIVTISVLSAIGAGWIILSFLVSHILN